MSGSGQINAHTHLYSGLVPLGMPSPRPAPESFIQILERVWWRLDRALDHESLAAAARYYMGEALLSGTTGLVDHHESPNCIEGSLDVLADAAQDLGMRAVLTYGASERNGGRAEASRGLAECRRFITENDRPLVRGVIGLHAPFTVSDETLREAGELARELGSVVHLHLAEDGTDGEDARGRGYAGSLERLLALKALPAGSLLAHGVHLTADEVRSCARHGLWLIRNPRSNRANGVGAPRHLELTDRAALGTDGFPSTMAAETAELGAADGSNLLAGGERLFDERFGSGGVACDRAPGTDNTRQLVVDGRTIVQDGVLMSANRDMLEATARTHAKRLWGLMAEHAGGGDHE
ncbi:MAG: amidohydrolase [Planctomycetes bacterium]|jgi:cytosine/adenosine deaminase-related metal-dependent hydrolase|nr:amidohydrolase [Planctomycetota bacterium]HJO26795.1 amidohydrolase family protein [Planctomycetota bacterium]